MNIYNKNPADPSFRDNFHQYFPQKEIWIYWTNTFPSLGEWPLFYYSDLSQQDLFSLLKFGNSFLKVQWKCALLEFTLIHVFSPSKTIHVDNTSVWYHHT